MGLFRVEVSAVGGHGCQRNIKDGEFLQVYCGNPSCPDCIAREFVRALKRAGVSVEADGADYSGYKKGAVIRHWPGQSSEVVDDLLTGKRTGSF